MSEPEYHSTACGDLRCPCYQAGLRADVAKVVARQATEIDRLRHLLWLKAAHAKHAAEPAAAGSAAPTGDDDG